MLCVQQKNKYFPGRNGVLWIHRSLIISYIALIYFSELVLLTMTIIVLFSECFSLQYFFTEIHCERLKTRCKWLRSLDFRFRSEFCQCFQMHSKGSVMHSAKILQTWPCLDLFWFSLRSTRYINEDRAQRQSGGPPGGTGCMLPCSL